MELEEKRTICPNCDRKNLDGRTTCIFCGTTLPTHDVPETGREDPERPRKELRIPRRKIIALVVGIAVVAGALWWLFWTVAERTESEPPLYLEPSKLPELRIDEIEGPIYTTTDHFRVHYSGRQSFEWTEYPNSFHIYIDDEMVKKWHPGLFKRFSGTVLVRTPEPGVHTLRMRFAEDGYSDEDSAEFEVEVPLET